jgi:predicted RNA-binding protein (virulence factor B family)
MKPGQTNSLIISEKISSGFILRDENQEKAFIQKVFAEDSWEIGTEVDVFIYQEEGTLKATTEKANAEIGEFAVMTCVQSLPSGAFMDGGLSKTFLFLINSRSPRLWKANDIWFMFISTRQQD